MILTCSAIIIALAAGLADAVYYGSGTVGASCNFNTDCVTAATMYCNVGACACYSDYTSYLGYCYAKIDPGTSGCAYDFQCSAVWPGATCVGSTGGAATDGTCRCPSPDYIERETRDGTVCTKFNDALGSPTDATCPLPENGGHSAVLTNDPTTTPPFIVQCNPDATAVDTTTPADGLCQYTSSDGVTLIDVSDRYDCIATSVLPGICCPNRAFTCIQSRQTPSTAITAETRYWYNSVTGGCEPFLWDPFDTTGIDVSPNNFRTLEHCQSYCGGTCDRGSPAYETPTTSTNVYDQTPDLCTYTTDCADSTNYACELVDSNSYCCPTVASNCGPYGGLADTTQALPNVGFLTTNYQTQTRYYYNEDTLTCTSFQYQGAGGNYNNFITQASCLQYCQASVCTQGNPLKDAVGATLTCSTSTSCPSTHTCYNARCCPKPRFVCQQEKRPGDGASSTNIRYWWNQYTRQCEELLYTGQNGNDNNFLTLTACQSYCSNIRIAPQCQQGEALVNTGVDQYTQCGTTTTTSCGSNYECTFDGYVYGCCPTKAYVCGISSSTGIVCNGPASTRYYYNTLTQTCTSFSFNGCDGNPNNFRDLNTCNTFCGAGGCPYGGTPYQATSSSSFQTCATTADCVGNYECTTVTAGITNNNYCCPSRSFVCQQSIYSGANCGTVSVTRWVYRYTTGVCEQFTFTGCAGTSNSFATQQQCLTFCGSSACLPGEVARADAFGSPLSCSSDASCGTGYKCRFDTLTSRSFCCGSDAAGVCNVDQRAYLDPSTGAASQCTPSLGSTACYTGFNCQLNTVLGKYYCCTSLNGTVCPVNRAPYQLNNVAQSCSLSVSGVCPTGYSCQTPLGAGYTSYTGFCCTSNDVCPTGGNYFRETTGTFIGSARACTIGGVACPTGFYCAPLNGGTSGYCCSGGATAENGGCPPGQFIQILTTSPTTYAYCNPFNG
uniref:BPTI/Kunitz inhibitor domain-containing protein n=1 Tax=Plectus sambesii TaxID=2011161 RepID=A0A914VUL2_9BILA